MISPREVLWQLAFLERHAPPAMRKVLGQAHAECLVAEGLIAADEMRTKSYKELELSVRAFGNIEHLAARCALSIETVGDLEKASEARLFDRMNGMKKTAKEVRLILAEVLKCGS